MKLDIRVSGFESWPYHSRGWMNSPARSPPLYPGLPVPPASPGKASFLRALARPLAHRRHGQQHPVQIQPLSWEKRKRHHQCQDTWVLALTPLLSYCVALDRSRPLSGPQPLPLSHEGIPGASFGVSSSASSSPASSPRGRGE